MGGTLRIAFVYDVIYPWVKGGVEKRIYEVAKRLAKRHEVHIYGYKLWDGKDEIEREGIVYHGTIRPKKIYSNGRRSIIPPVLHALKLVPLFKNEKFDIIDCQASPYFPAYSSKAGAMFGDSKLIITWHEFWGRYWLRYLGKAGILGQVIEKGLFDLTDNHIAVSLKTKRDLYNAGLRKNVAVIPNGIDFKRIQRIKNADLESDIIFVGRLIKEKNVQLLLNAVRIIKKEVPDTKVLIIGDGPERKRLENLSKRLDISENVQFLGFLESYDDVIAHMKASKVFAFPSLREGFGIVVLEANASGLPVVTVNYEMNASRDLIIEGKNGFISNIDEKSFAEKVLTAIEKRRKMKNAAIDIASRYDWDEIVGGLERYYGGVV
ncbi:glycosyltransferase family 4 protein [Thermococcus barophilus]|uniref:Phosphatidylinositol N-acetylglucosaminyltransferase n=1 Tax=Thermococcus barophilus TaxID=55802 RepID=A0A0S1XEI7_THEBA|nr:glycosyltransferase family 4 protein [Thermococcus barophilus]ALM76147.1 Phosphatidylinositol N-acetylglucosaminyltransferase [Thermococcus barophilus]